MCGPITYINLFLFYYVFGVKSRLAMGDDIRDESSTLDVPEPAETLDLDYVSGTRLSKMLGAS